MPKLSDRPRYMKGGANLYKNEKILTANMYDSKDGMVLFRCRLLYLPLMLLQSSLLAGGWRLAGLLLDVWQILQSKSKIIYRQWYNYMVSFGKHFICTSACLRASLFIFYRVFIACSSWCVKFSRRLVFRKLLETKIMFASR